MVPVLVAALLFGAAFPLCKALSKDWSPIPLAGALYLSSGLGLLGVMPFLRAGERLQRGDLKWLAPAVLFGGVVAPIAFTYGARFTTGTAGSLLVNLETVFTAAIAVAFFGERLKGREWAALTFILLGAVVVSGATAEQKQATQPVLGGVLVAAACLGWALDNNFTKRISSRDPIQIACVKGLVAGAVSLGLGAAMGQTVPWSSSRALGSAAVVGVFSYGVSLVLFVIGLRRLGSAKTSALFASSALSGVAVAWIVLEETPGWITLAGGGGIVAGLIWLALIPRPSAPIDARDGPARTSGH